MASEISVTATLRVSKGGASIAPTKTKVFDMGGDYLTDNVQKIGTATEAIEFGDVSLVGGYVYIHNLDTVKTVTISLAATNPMVVSFITLQPDGIAIFPCTTLTMYAAASADFASVEFAACDF